MLCRARSALLHVALCSPGFLAACSLRCHAQPFALPLLLHNPQLSLQAASVQELPKAASAMQDPAQHMCCQCRALQGRLQAAGFLAWQGGPCVAAVPSCRLCSCLQGVQGTPKLALKPAERRQQRLSGATICGMLVAPLFMTPASAALLQPHVRDLLDPFAGVRPPACPSSPCYAMIARSWPD